ncbi:hypothetical protein A3E45_05205 [Candidatus Daviesbacteria bacterium RIFCSPHIGHO2_12_FULL_43_11]|uniref:Uncharacterized protein n=2 Tax=Candidatus Daviesiibacteriota TaxID=1752718 RepID=A0A1F5K469_9BACT|nr:MAG: hypothetical protein UV33_C0047G0005 [Candidatus Daviesbacteria bacterium GW2011_GWA1_42_6]OGE20251.1 MAG: hypothetical protein A2874_03105 [Candidatus Daviesbacteria bacterium RIFCSPHIGHO2_01_FULL_43_17]OGE35605.1 MAG: hypothetical protein A3E45_05205 [Candidatus Daviesbacteria bacterium RIFCSPHIGHO2_12_FULL_43_11]OGE70640.1 MAG: hypothetical protein A3J21_02560 [Candidatus Daviesbacteria bacterium RIFCSPLOWO2_02_FULL_43_11]
MTEFYSPDRRLVDEIVRKAEDQVTRQALTENLDSPILTLMAVVRRAQISLKVYYPFLERKWYGQDPGEMWLANISTGQ